MFGAITSNVDLNLRGLSALDDGGDGLGGSPRQITPEMADRVATIDGVAAVERNVEGVATLIDEQGEPIGGQGPPTLGFNAPTVDEPNAAQLRDGRYPTGAHESGWSPRSSESAWASAWPPGCRAF